MSNVFLLQQDQPQDQTDFFLATVSAVDNTKGMKIIPDGQSTAMQKWYKILCTGKVAAVGDRVVVMRNSGTCIVLGKIGVTSSGGGSITVDDALSTVSENPVQNKVITNALGDKVAKAGDTMTGELLLDGSGLSLQDYYRFRIKGNKKSKAGETPAIESTSNFGGFQILDSEDNLIFYNQASLSTSQERIYTSYIVRRLLSDNTQVSNGFYIGVNANGSAYMAFAGDGQSAWLSALGLSWTSAATTTSTVSDIASAGSDCSITSADFAQYGKIAQLRLVVKKTTSVASGNTTMATLVAAKCPIFNTFATTHTNQGTVAYINANGNVVVNGAINANQSITIYSTYILP